ncbi:hypothetical protein EYC84_009933 [Monilinia fructicola]|uniref:Uncharacterized protein n=1 Tax=Monilinia fructicola TaxID=38448 RepID=A0A5M9JBW2_MONFR|nr:hypothetical protein EYC84_009933 [Monilinia fructicola]
MPLKFFNSRLERKSSKGKKSVPPTIFPPNLPQTLSIEDKPLPLIPKFSAGALGRLLPRRRDSVVLPRVLGSLTRGMERASGARSLSRKKITGTETDAITPLLLTSPEAEPEIVIAEDDEGIMEEGEYEEGEVRDAVEMTIVPVRARFIYIGGKGSTSRGGAEGR